MYRGYITCDLLGPGDGSANFGLGNQLFQVATLLSLGHDNHINLSIPQLADPRFGGYHKNIFRRISTTAIDTTGFKNITVPFEYTNLLNERNVVYRGYFQSEKYFAHNRKSILDVFAAHESLQDYIDEKYGSILAKNTISVHIRRGDYVHKSDRHPVLPSKYYIDAINHLTKYDRYDSYVIFSDDIKWCKQEYGISDSITYIEGEPDYVDLYIMSQCKHNIIANSTFSWWGAWLNQNPNKIVIAPKQWFGPAVTNMNSDDIIPESWIRI